MAQQQVYKRTVTVNTTLNKNDKTEAFTGCNMNVSLRKGVKRYEDAQKTKMSLIKRYLYECCFMFLQFLTKYFF